MAIEVEGLDVELLRSGDEWKVDRVQANILQPPAGTSV